MLLENRLADSIRRLDELETPELQQVDAFFAAKEEGISMPEPTSDRAREIAFHAFTGIDPEEPKLCIARIRRRIAELLRQAV